MLKKTLISIIFDSKLIYSIFLIYFILSLVTLNMWDAYNFDYAFSRNNLDGLNLWAIEHSHRCYLLLINTLFFLKTKLNLSNELLFDIFNFSSLIFYISQIRIMGKIYFNLKKKWLNLLSVILLVLPIWEGFTSLPLGFYLFFFGISLLGFRFYFYTNNNLKKYFGLILIIGSLCVQSNSAIILGLMICTIIKSKYNKILILNSLFIFIVIVSIFLIRQFYFPAYNFWENYNEIKIIYLSPQYLIKNLFNYSTFYLYFSWVIFFYIYLNFKSKYKKKLLSKNDLIIILILFISSVGPYLLINKSTDIFAWKDYLGRHAYLMSISFAFFFTLLFKKIFEIDQNSRKKLFLICVTIFLFQGLFTQFSKFYFKIEATVFQKSFVDNLKKFKKPKSGLIQFKTFEGIKFNDRDESDYLPGHRIRNHEISVLFYKAYGEASWLFYVPKSKNKKPLNFNKYKTLFNADEFDINSKCKIEVFFSKNLSYYERIKFLYIFNSNKYYNIKKIHTNCS